MSLNQPIGLLGGTFDPIHFGHLRTALELQQSLNLAEVRLIPCFQPVHRLTPVASPEQRLKMVQLATADEPVLKADDCEIKRQGPSYMVDTLLFFRQNYPTTPLCLIVGIDALLDFAQWHRYEDIPALAHLIVVHRPQYTLPQEGLTFEFIRQYLKDNTGFIQESTCGSIIYHPVTPLEISATYIRTQIGIGKNPRYLLPDNVNKYIKDHGIYSLSQL